MKKKLNAKGAIHLDILKVQHHGSEHNLNHEFCKKVTADHYVFCGNGAHHNPDLDVIKTIIESRISQGPNRSITAEVGNEFKLWFNSSSAVTRSTYKEHMVSVEKLVKKIASDHSQIKFQFMPPNTSKLEIDL
ncbi:MAG: hypothetical protein RIC06_15080 [Cyclobacteriaceae bacterium]